MENLISKYSEISKVYDRLSKNFKELMNLEKKTNQKIDEEVFTNS